MKLPGESEALGKLPVTSEVSEFVNEFGVFGKELVGITMVTDIGRMHQSYGAAQQAGSTDRTV